MKKLIFTLAIAMMVCSSGNVFAQRSDRMAKAKAIAQQRFQKDGDGLYEPVLANYSDESDQYQVTYSYDEYDYYLLEELTQKKVGSNWENDELITYEYDWSGNPSMILVQEWENGAWVNEEIQNCTYDNDGMPDEVIIQEWENGAWVNEEKVNYTFTDDVTRILTSEWSGVWNAEDLITITYSMDGYEMVEQYMQQGAWQNEARMLVSYNDDFNIATEIVQEWEDNSWVNVMRMNYNYEGLVYTSVVYDVWTGDWGELAKTEYAYDNNGNAKQGVAYVKINDQWMEGFATDIEMPYAYNEKSKVFIASEVTVDYADITLSTNEMTQTTAFNLYPNPANGMINVNGEGFEKAEIYNIAGQKVMESSNAQIDVKALQAGVYMVKVFGNGSSEMLRVVVK
ncbi:MAG: T9SS type A sorting domain-containing protein [Bacteroidales bacterium]|nr:T9SS type A sorting domain-containing protein [Bacteroidales bacterium]